MTTKLIACAATVAVCVAFAPVAEAGGGVRLSFGGPLGTFTATPSKGAASRSAKPPRATPVRKAKQAAYKPRPTLAARKSERPAPTQPAAHEAKRIDTARTEVAKAEIGAELLAARTGTSALINSAVTEHATESERATDAPAVAQEANERAETNETAETVGACTKFIPAVGMTVTVGCDD